MDSENLDFAMNAAKSGESFNKTGTCEQLRERVWVEDETLDGSGKWSMKGWAALLLLLLLLQLLLLT